MNKVAEQITQNLKVGKKKRTFDDSKIEQDLSIYKNPSKKPGQNLKCDICNKSFTQKSNLRQHVASVHEGKTFKCDFCSSNFTEKGGLKRHIKSVHEEKTAPLPKG